MIVSSVSVDFTPLFGAADLAKWRPMDGWPLSECAERGAVRATGPNGEQRAILARPLQLDALRWIQQNGPVLEEAGVEREHFDAWIRTYTENSGALGAATGAVADVGVAELGVKPEVLSLRQLDLTGSPVVRIVNAMLFDAMRAGASDVHVESHQTGFCIKYRMDGVLRGMADISGVSRAEQVISRIKVMAELDIAERRVPQDGRLQVALEGRSIDVRVSVMPSIHGEDAVLRILDRQHLARQLKDLTLEALGFTGTLIRPFEALARRPHGMVLVTGPTGSGKTTTLYAVINRTTTGLEKVVTIEDPVEYQLPGVLQIPVNERKGLSFARGLRSILRHDPDKILVGEIRDAETAQIAVQAALTGHLVFTTVHANDVLDVIGRFKQFGIDSYSLMSALNGVLAQRLLRRVCQACARPQAAGPRVTAVGCERCGGTGYRGRFAIGELLVLGPRLKALIGEGASLDAVQQAATEQGRVSLRRQALDACDEGITTLEEVDRVTVDL